jgi:hypothetical protein
MFQMCGVFAEFERAMIVERVNSGLARAKAKGVKLGRGNKKDGERSADEESRAELEKRVLRLHKGGTGILKIGKALGIGPAHRGRSRDAISDIAHHKFFGHHQLETAGTTTSTITTTGARGGRQPYQHGHKS